MLSVLLRYTDSDYPFGIFKLFLHMKIHRNQIINISLFSQLMIGWWFVPSFRTISTGLFMGHSVGGWTGGEETRVLSFYAFISTNPSAISLAKADNFIGFTWSNAQCHLWYAGFFLLCVILHLVEIKKKGRFGCHWNLFNPILTLHFCVKLRLCHVRLTWLYVYTFMSDVFDGWVDA